MREDRSFRQRMLRLIREKRRLETKEGKTRLCETGMNWEARLRTLGATESSLWIRSEKEIDSRI